ncbi:MAG: TetR/AcrR family transcriptional regulator [Lewinellaceae bacterium]|nr:TetR/AcrR family transcriptional regulator [Lewinellaceae bacterium]
MTAQPDSSKSLDILNTARQLFWKHGIRRVSVEEICREAGASKMTFYRSFPNKIELAKAMLQKMFDESMNEYSAIMALDIPFEEKVQKQLLLKFKGARGISAELVRDIYSNQEWGLREYMERRTEEALKVIMNDFAQAQQKGWIRQDLRLDFILFLFHRMQDWITNEQLLASYPDTQDLIMEITNFFFYGIMPHESKGHER